MFESLKIVAAEIREPLKSEFLAIIETQAIGMTMDQACARRTSACLAEVELLRHRDRDPAKIRRQSVRSPRYFVRVLRDRKKVAEKIQAMSAEAKASARIIGSFPPVVMLLVYLSSPDYISMLWTRAMGQLMLVGCVIWMTIGIFVMKRMINFDF